MKRLVLVGTLMGGTLMGALTAATALAQTTPAAGTSLGTVHLTKSVMADGKPLPAGTYQVRLTSDEPKPAVGQSENAERFVEFVKGGKVIGREVATVVGAADISSIAKGRTPRANSAIVEMLKGGDYWRVWINRGGNNYIINMPPA